MSNSINIRSNNSRSRPSHRPRSRLARYRGLRLLRIRLLALLKLNDHCVRIRVSNTTIRSRARQGHMEITSTPSTPRLNRGNAFPDPLRLPLHPSSYPLPLNDSRLPILSPPSHRAYLLLRPPRTGGLLSPPHSSKIRKLTSSRGPVTIQTPQVQAKDIIRTTVTGTIQFILCSEVRHQVLRVLAS